MLNSLTVEWQGHKINTDGETIVSFCLNSYRTNVREKKEKKAVRLQHERVQDFSTLFWAFVCFLHFLLSTGKTSLFVLFSFATGVANLDIFGLIVNLKSN